MGNDHKWWIDKDTEGGGQGLFEFAWRDWGKPQKTSVMRASNLVKIQVVYILNTSPLC